MQVPQSWQWGCGAASVRRGRGCPVLHMASSSQQHGESRAWLSPSAKVVLPPGKRNKERAEIEGTPTLQAGGGAWHPSRCCLKPLKHPCWRKGKVWGKSSGGDELRGAGCSFPSQRCCRDRMRMGHASRGVGRKVKPGKKGTNGVVLMFYFGLHELIITFLFWLSIS